MQRNKLRVKENEETEDYALNEGKKNKTQGQKKPSKTTLMKKSDNLNIKLW